VGNDKYQNFSDLSGCINDVNALMPLLARNYDSSPNFECQVGSNLTRDELIGAVDRLLAPGAESGMLFFAGHGGPSPDDVVLVSNDGTAGTPGLAFSEVLAKIVQSELREIVVILDCCFSGGAGGVPALASNAASIRPGLSILAASRSDQASAETTAARGLFSTYVEGALGGGASDTLGKVDLGGLYAYVSESFGAWDQRPTFKTNIERPQELRICEPAIHSTQLREILELFGNDAEVFALDSTYESTVAPSNPDHERIFALLQNARASRLVEPVAEDHLYFAAMNSTGCRLTPLGRHYHHVHADGRL